MSIKFDKIGDTDCSMFVSAHFQTRYQYQRKLYGYETLFEQFCRRVFELMIKDEIPIEIDLTLNRIKNHGDKDRKYYKDVYDSYFNQEKMLKEYKEPKCNKYCEPLPIPKMSFKIEKDTEPDWVKLENPTITISISIANAKPTAIFNPVD